MGDKICRYCDDAGCARCNPWFKDDTVTDDEAAFKAADTALEYVLADILVELRRISSKLDVLTELAPVIHKLTTSPLGRLLK